MNSTRICNRDTSIGTLNQALDLDSFPQLIKYVFSSGVDLQLCFGFMGILKKNIINSRNQPSKKCW